MSNEEMMICEGFTPYDGCYVPPMPEELKYLYIPRSHGSMEEPPEAAPIHDFDSELELEIEQAE